MEKLEYVNNKISEVTNRLSDYANRVEILWWEQCILDDLKKELGILNSIKNDLQADS